MFLIEWERCSTVLLACSLSLPSLSFPSPFSPVFVLSPCTTAMLDHVKVKTVSGDEKRLQDMCQISQRADNNFILNFPGQPEVSSEAN